MVTLDLVISFWNIGNSLYRNLVSIIAHCYERQLVRDLGFNGNEMTEKFYLDTTLEPKNFNEPEISEMDLVKIKEKIM